ncbi:MAG: DinB family protein [Chitinophagaceae bacterium]
MDNILSAHYLKELNLEYKSTHACLERIPGELFEFKPHPKSMALGYLAQLVAEIPLWISKMVSEGEIDFATFKHGNPKNAEELVKYLDENMASARQALFGIKDNDLDASFSLKANGQVLYTSTKLIDIGITLNHWVHHRGQLTVYMRLNDIPVPSLYGPSADDKTFVAPE